MHPDFRLETDHLTLRPVVPSDRSDLVALEADPDVMRYLNGGRPVPEEGLPDADFLTPRGHEPEVLVAAERATGRFVGWFAIFDDGTILGERRAEIGYRLRREAWGKGYASEGAGALVAHGFDSMGFDCIRAQTMAVNLASRRVMEKIGMRYLETQFPDFADPIPGSELGEVVFEIRRMPV